MSGLYSVLLIYYLLESLDLILIKVYPIKAMSDSTFSWHSFVWEGMESIFGQIVSLIRTASKLVVCQGNEFPKKRLFLR